MNSDLQPVVLGERPFVSFVLPVYNGATFLRSAIDSILRQTIQSFELVVIDDGSTDDSSAIVSKYIDPRIRFYLQRNHGLAATLNRAISLATGKYIARQDQDDVSLSDRLAKQVAFLEANPDHAMVGTWAEIWEGEKRTARLHKHPSSNLALKFGLLFDNPFVHSSMMIRRSALDVVGGYSTDKNRQPPEDYELWTRIAQRFKVANISEVLHVYRELPQSMSRSGDSPFLDHLLSINVENLMLATSGAYQELACKDLAALSHGEYGRYSRATSLKEMATIIQAAAQKLARDEGEDLVIIRDAVQSRLNNLRYHYYQSHYLGGVSGSLRKLRRHALSLCKRLFARDC